MHVFTTNVLTIFWPGALDELLGLCDPGLLFFFFTKFENQQILKSNERLQY